MWSPKRKLGRSVLQEFHGGLGDAKPLLDEVSKAEAAALKEGGEAQRRKVALDAEHEDRIVGFVGRGKAEVDTSAGDVKQGGYGKVPTHKIPKLDQLMRPLEIISALRLKCTGLLENNIKERTIGWLRFSYCGQTDEDIEFCDDMLGKVSRSFAAVIRQLPTQLSIDICIFYLVLRALDTVEDDMEAYKGRESDKQAELISFGEKRLTDPNCSITGVGAADERTLVENFGRVELAPEMVLPSNGLARVFAKLSEGSREVIRNITDKMGAGMAEYVSADLAQGTLDQAAYNRYCHMVAGLVGEGLTRIFVALNWQGKASKCGAFAQTLRKKLQTLTTWRTMWMDEHFGLNQFGKAMPTAMTWASLHCPLHMVQEKPGDRSKLLPVKAGGEVLAKGVGVQALLCLNDLVADALELVPDSLEYLERVSTPAIYRFCAIPQVMAIATLAACFDNPLVFTGVVKIRKGLTARLIVACCDGPNAVHFWFRQFAEEILAQTKTCVGADGPVGKRLEKSCHRILERRTTSHLTAENRFFQAISNGRALDISLSLIVSGRFVPLEDTEEVGSLVRQADAEAAGRGCGDCPGSLLLVRGNISTEPKVMQLFRLLLEASCIRCSQSSMPCF
eukprot:g14084.t1